MTFAPENETEMLQSDQTTSLQIDIVSDVVCPWCVVGYRQLQLALEETGVRAHVRWHPFELNPDMPPEGQNLREHLTEKYGTTLKQSQAARARLVEAGSRLGFTFNFSDDSRMVNSFLAHQLVEWAEEKGRQMDVKLALFQAHFTDARDVSDIATLGDIAAELGLDRDEATTTLQGGQLAWNVRTMQKFWTDKGIRGVPGMVFGLKHLVTGAQGVEAYANVLRNLGTRPT